MTFSLNFDFILFEFIIKFTHADLVCIHTDEINQHCGLLPGW